MSRIITVENLSKKYTIGHQTQGSYQTFRDTLAHQAKSLYQRFRHPLSPNPEEVKTEEFWALKNINFEVNQGDRIGIIGHNGAGKSTLLKILSRITHPTTGRIHIKGRIASLLEVGTGFHPELTGRENIFLNGAILGMTRQDIRQRFDEIVTFSEIEKFLDTPVKRYSSGMYVRLAFAVAAHLEPDILVVDEVLAVGDMQFQKKCLGKMNDVSTEGRTILFISHQMSAISGLCNRGVVIHKGTLAYDGTANNAIDHYLSENSQLNDGYSDFNSEIYNNRKFPLIKSVGLLSKDKQNYRNSISTGETFELEIAFNIERKGIDYCFIGFHSMKGERIFSSGTHLDKFFSQQLFGVGKLLCSIHDFPLVDGEYYVDVALGTKAIGNVDYIQNAISFRVQLNDFFKTGQVLLPGQGCFAVKSQWFTI